MCCRSTASSSTPPSPRPIASTRPGSARPGRPLAVVRPTTTQQVSAILRVAHAHRVPVVPQGARTGLAGGANAVDGGLVLSLTADGPDPRPGPRRAGRRRPARGGQRPTSRTRPPSTGCSIRRTRRRFASARSAGTWPPVAGGLRCVKYGVTRDCRTGLEVVLASGEVLRTGSPTAKGVAGYDLTRLIVGSEGTLGVITEATLALRPLPEPALTAGRGVPVRGDRDAGGRADHGRRARGPHCSSSSTAPPSARCRTIATSACRGTPAPCCSRSPTAGRVPPTTWSAIGRVVHRRRSDRDGRRLGRDGVRAAARGEAPRPLAVSTRSARPSSRTSASRGPGSPTSSTGSGASPTSTRLLIACAGHVGDGNMHPTVVFDRGRRRGRAAGVRRVRRGHGAGPAARRHDHRRARRRACSSATGSRVELVPGGAPRAPSRSSTPSTRTGSSTRARCL